MSGIIFILNSLNFFSILPREMTKSLKLQQKLAERREAVLLLRFRTSTPKLNAFKYCSYKKIAKVVDLSMNQV